MRWGPPATCPCGSATVIFMKVLRRLAAFTGLWTCVCCLAYGQGALPEQSKTGRPAVTGTPSAEAKPVYEIGPDVQAPVLLHQVDPEYSSEARKKKISGEVRVGLIVDEAGIPQKVHVIYGIGYGLDENAVATVQQYRFKPAMTSDVPVAVRIVVAVRYQIFSRQ